MNKDEKKNKIQNAAHQMNRTYLKMMTVRYMLSDIDGTESIRQAITTIAAAAKTISKMIERLNKEVKTND